MLGGPASERAPERVRAPRRGPGRWLLRAALGGARSRTARVLLYPATAIVIALLAFPALYFSDAISALLAVSGGHAIALAVFLGAGVVAAGTREPRARAGERPPPEERAAATAAAEGDPGGETRTPESE